MRIRTLLLCAAFLTVLTSRAAAQTSAPNTDSRTLQSILEEMRKLRQDLRTTSIQAQRAQILLYRVRLQLDVVERATQQLNEVRTSAAQQKNELEQFDEAMKRFEEQIDQSQDPAQKKQFEMERSMVQKHFEQLRTSASDNQTKEADLTNQLRNEQAKLDELQEQLDRLDKKLESDSRKPAEDSR
jgi:chromosome segregation ATPase